MRRMNMGACGAELSMDLSRRACPSRHSRRNRWARAAWMLVWLCLFRPSPVFCRAWRRMLLRCFGAGIGPGVKVLPSVRIWAPWNLDMAAESCLGAQVDCYNVAPVTLGAHATVSQYSFLCSASHDPSDPNMALVSAPINILQEAWVCADVFVGPGVTVGEGAVVGARSSVFRDLPPWQICHGTPARAVRARVLRSSPGGVNHA